MPKVIDHSKFDFDFGSLGMEKSLVIAMDEFHFIPQAQRWAESNRLKCVVKKTPHGYREIWFENFQAAEDPSFAILGAIKYKPDSTISYIHNRSNIRLKYSKEDVLQYLNSLVADGKVVKNTSFDRRNGKPVIKYSLS